MDFDYIFALKKQKKKGKRQLMSYIKCYSGVEFCSITSAMKIEVVSYLFNISITLKMFTLGQDLYKAYS